MGIGSAVSKREKRMQRLEGNFTFVFSCINCICFGWADMRQILRVHIEPGKKNHSTLFDISNKMADEIQCR